MSSSIGRVLIVAGSDSGGGAGIQADIKTVTALGGFAMTAVTAITVQNTLGVTGVHGVPLDIVAAQIESVVTDLGVDAVKTGMLGTAATVEVVAQALARFAPDTPRIVDPVMVAKGGHPLLEPDAVVAVVAHMIPGAALVTPNAPEAERLTGLPVANLDGQRAAAERLVELGARAALVKGGHLDGDILRDVLVTADGRTLVVEGPRIATRATHGTGCTYASAIAAFVARGADLETAIRSAHAYLAEAIRRAPGLGAGHGPLAHGWPFADGGR
ncbi:MAG: bifunctional hydroxymethylpyrimidine kinase/phosphomethylpyrimidine kinase [Alphaproteobacteria bacterium]|nr:bifunctional hydroxymethylpyrimidine kinase/phosphomethylpyrimidine kinase [Alphaproteobacteria bacterium]